MSSDDITSGDIALAYGAYRRQNVPRLSKPRISRHTDVPKAGLLNLSQLKQQYACHKGGRQSRKQPPEHHQRQRDLQRKFREHVHNKPRPRLPRRLVPPPVAVSAEITSIATEDVNETMAWPDLKVEDCIPVAPKPQESDTELQQESESPRKRRSVLRSLSLRGRPDCSSSMGGSMGFMRSKSRDVATAANSRTNSMTGTAAAESFAGEGYVPQVVESTRYAMSKRGSISHKDSTTMWAAQRRLSLTSSGVLEPDLRSPLTGTEHTPSPSLPVTRAGSEASLYTPTRRRSIIQTPGVATRATRPPPALLVTPAHAGARCSMPPATPSSASRRISADSTAIGPGNAHTTPPSLTMVIPAPLSPPAFGTEDGRDVVRVLTPSEDDYKQLGGIKFGSLRIVNGSPVRSPDIDGEKHEPWGRSTPLASSTNLEAPSAQRCQRSPTSSPWQERGGSADDVLMMKSLKHQSRPLSPMDSFGEETPVKFSSKIETGGKETTQIDLAEEHAFLDLLSFSPMMAQSLRLPERLPEFITTRLETGSKPPAAEELLSYPEHRSSAVTALEYLPDNEVLFVRDDPKAKQKRPEPDPTPQHTSRPFSRSDSGIVTSPVSSQVSGVALSKADSGYSSNKSLKSMRGSINGSSPSKENEMCTGSMLSDANTKKMMHGNGSKDKNGSAGTDAPNEDVQQIMGGSQTRSSRDSTTLPSSTAQAQSPTWPTRHNHLAWLTMSNQYRRFRADSTPGSKVQAKVASPPPSAHRFSASVPDAPRATAEGIEATGPLRPSKLKRLFSCARRIPTVALPPVYATHALHRSVPSVPQELEAKLYERGLVPTITNRLALKTQTSKETLQTIFSVGSLEVCGDGCEAYAAKSLQSFPTTTVPSARLLVPRKPIPPLKPYSAARSPSVDNNPLSARASERPYKRYELAVATCRVRCTSSTGVKKERIIHRPTAVTISDQAHNGVAQDDACVGNTCGRTMSLHSLPASFDKSSTSDSPRGATSAPWSAPPSRTQPPGPPVSIFNRFSNRVSRRRAVPGPAMTRMGGLVPGQGPGDGHSRRCISLNSSGIAGLETDGQGPWLAPHSYDQGRSRSFGCAGSARDYYLQQTRAMGCQNSPGDLRMASGGGFASTSQIPTSQSRHATPRLDEPEDPFLHADFGPGGELQIQRTQGNHVGTQSMTRHPLRVLHYSFDSEKPTPFEGEASYLTTVNA